MQRYTTIFNQTHNTLVQYDPFIHPHILNFLDALVSIVVQIVVVKFEAYFAIWPYGLVAMYYFTTIPYGHLRDE